ncbi:alpha/beta hydrolase [Catellatospora sp. TT07R-123]|uniref:alpha/beta fold hydrolase n=1 Tax=Catellatospora sp. TT07R-123 TaxID=2733863 RepID=UPI001B1AF541|nr:alpha/beta fold hydrolase [Catellatospora sp. TT07R-123]GHJ45202.1 alpha/beta hydrolase [Catellatospora sp. TT07R-123]
MPLAYDLEGPDGAETVVLLHSSVCDRRMWQPQREPLLAAGYRVLAPDFRGFGDSAYPTGPYNNAEDVIALLDSLGIERFALVGASYGGRVSQEVAARWPDRVTTLALLCAARRGQEPTAAIEAFSEQEEKLVEAGDLAGATALNLALFVGPRADAATRELVTAMQLHNFEVQLGGADHGRSDQDHDLGAVTARTLVVSGAHDVDFFTQTAEHLATHIPGARHLALDWAGHLPSLEDPAALNPLLLEFLHG